MPRSLPAKTFYGTEISRGDARAALLAQMVQDGLVGVSLIPHDIQLAPSYTAFPQWADRLLTAADLLFLSAPKKAFAEAPENTEEGEPSSPGDSKSEEPSRETSDSESSGEDDSSEEKEEQPSEKEEEDSSEEEEDAIADELADLFELIPVDSLRDDEAVKSMPISELREYGELFDPPVKGVAKAELASEILERIDAMQAPE